MSFISIEGMEFFSHHGCFKEEQIIGTKFIVDFYFETDTTVAEEQDDISKTVNYQAVYSLIKDEMNIKSRLLENIARRILNSICKAFPLIEGADVKISKINPQMGGKIEKVSVTLSTDDLDEKY
ncbi:MAG: dihydroneopterin aldolase [Bacteroidales bacterium]|nr:dihydroneopterin aldolase [Bacteroidales bacterium]